MKTTTLTYYLDRIITDLKMTRTAFGRAVGVTHPTVLKWFDGTSIPSPSHCYEIARVAGKDPDEVLGVAGHRRPLTKETEDDTTRRLSRTDHGVVLTPEEQAVIIAIYQRLQGTS